MEYKVKSLSFFQLFSESFKAVKANFFKLFIVQFIVAIPMLATYLFYISNLSEFTMDPSMMVETDDFMNAYLTSMQSGINLMVERPVTSIEYPAK